MNKISNDFVTIEYNSKEERKIAKYYIKLFNEEPDFYKMILNGRTTIHSNELIEIRFPSYKDEYYENFLKKQNRETIIESFLKLENTPQQSFYEPSMSDVYYETIGLHTIKPSKDELSQIYYELGYYYYNLTKDFKYLKDYYYGKASLREQSDFIADYLVENMYDDLLKEKIRNDRRNTPTEYMTENFPEIIKIVEYIDKISKEEYSLYDKETKIPIINDTEFKELVMGALNYIDPTNKLLEEYKQAYEEGRIIEKPGEEGRISNCFNIATSEYFFSGKIKVSSGLGIELYKGNNLNDVREFIHEFGHFHYKLKHSNIFTECPSIYYELKALEFLEKIGYSKQEVLAVKKLRLENNRMLALMTLPNLFCLCQNGNKYYEECKSEPVKEYINYLLDNVIDDSTIEDLHFIKRVGGITRENKKLLSMYYSLFTKDQVTDRLAYIVGTYFSEYAIANLDHKFALKMINKMKGNKITLDDMQNMLYTGIIQKEKHPQYKKTKQVQ